jgi:hypothetical protein
MGSGWVEGIHADDLHECLNIFLLAFEKRELFERRYRLRRYDRTYRWILDRGAPFSDAFGNFGGYIGGCMDITELVEAEGVLQRMREVEEKVLKGLLPICCSCKKIRDDQGNWNQLERYITEHSEACFTHGICPQCATKLYRSVHHKA